MSNKFGQNFPESIASVLEKEIWLWRNQSAMESLKRGLEEATKGETQDLGCFAEYFDIDIDD